MNNMNAVDYLTKKANDNGVFDINQNRQLNTDLSEEQKNKIAKNAFINPNYNKAGISNTFVEGLTDRSKYDYDINWNDNPFKSNDVGDLRAEAQGGLGRLKDATINNITIAGTTALSSSIGFVGGVISAAIQGDASKIWDNDFTNKLNELQKGVTENNQIYRVQEYQNKSFLGKLTDGIFWADLWQNAGYMEGMLIPGTAIGKAAKATQIASKFPKMTKVATNLIAASGEASMEALNQKNKAYDNLFNQATDLYYNRLELAKNDNERRGAYDEYLDNLQLINDDAVRQGNRTFVGNMVILTTTGTLEFGDFVSRGYGESHKLLNRIARNELGQATARGVASDIAKGTGQFLKNFTVEGLEEYTQRGAASGAANTKGANQFLSKYADELNIELADNYLQAVGQAWVDDFDNEEAWLEFMSGAILGGIGLPGSHNGIRAQISDAKKEGDLRRKLAQDVNNLEGNLNINPSDLKNNGKLQETLDFLIRKQGITQNQKDALYNRDKNEFVNSRVEDILNYAMLYDNIGELDEFKERLKQYSTIDNQEQLTGENGLVTATQDENGNSPFKDKSISEVNQLLKESYDFWNKTIDSYIQGKQILDTMSKGKLDDNTLKRGAISFAQSRNFKDRAGELYNDLNNKINKYQESITKVSNEPKDAEFINNFFEGIKNLSENEVLPTFGSTKTVSSIYALTDFVNKNSSKIDSEVVNDIINPIVDLIKVSYDYYAYNNDFNSILKNAEKEQSKTDKMFNNLKNIKKNYLVKRYAKRLDGISDRKTIQEQIKNIPSEIREDVIEYLKNNGNEAIRKVLADRDSWDNASRAIMKVIDSYDEELFPVSRKEANDKYGKENVDKVINWLKDAFANSVSKDEVLQKLNNNLEIEAKAVNDETDADKKLKKTEDFNKTKAFVDELIKKINGYINEETKVSDKKKKDNNKKEYVDMSEEDDVDEGVKPTNSSEIPSYIPAVWKTRIKNKDKKYLEERLKILKEQGVEGLAATEKITIKRGDPDGKLTIKFLEDLLSGKTESTKDEIEGDLLEGKKKTELKDVQPTQTTNIGTEPNNNNEIKNEGPNTVSSIGISKYNHEEAKKGNLVIYDENNPIYKMLEEFGAYDFVDNGRLYEYLQFCAANNIDLNSVIRYIKTSIEYTNKETNETEIHPVYLLAVNSDNNFFNRQEKQTKKLNIDGSNYQVLGMMSWNTNNQNSIDEWEKLQKNIDKDCGEVGVGEFKLSSLTNGVSKINAGRLVFHSDMNDNGMRTLLSDISEDEFEIGVYDYTNELFTDKSVNKEDLVQPNINSRTPGTVYIFIKCADGKYYPRQLRSKKFVKGELNNNDLQNDIYIKKIKEHLKLMCDPSLTEGRRAQEKNALQRFISFDTEKYSIDDLIGFNKDKYDSNKIVVNGEWFDITEDGVEDKIFDAIISIKDLKLTPRIHIGEHSDYDYLKSLIRQSTVINSDVRMKSIDCNFELYTTNDDGSINQKETITSSFNKSIKSGLGDKSLFSFHPAQVKEIKEKFKDILPYDLDIKTIRVDSEIDEKENTYRFFVNGNLLNENYELNGLLNFIYNSLKNGKGLSEDFYSFTSDFNGVLFKMTKNSENTYFITRGQDAVNEYNELKKKEKEEKQQASANDLNNQQRPSENEEPVTQTQQSDESVEELETGEEDSGYIDPTEDSYTDDDEDVAEDNAEDCGEQPPF